MVHFVLCCSRSCNISSKLIAHEKYTNDLCVNMGPGLNLALPMYIFKKKVNSVFLVESCLHLTS